jgi:hypothetical protein
VIVICRELKIVGVVEMVQQLRQVRVVQGHRFIVLVEADAGVGVRPCGP